MISPVNDGTVTDAPQGDPVGMIVAKVDKETGKASPLGKGTLAGAEYTVCYYAGQYDENNLPSVATRTWVFKTDEDGYAGLDKDHLVSGDPFYTDTNGHYTLPLGTVSIQETKAPTGYLLSDTKASVQHVTSEGFLETVHTFVEPDENNPTTRESVRRGDVTLVNLLYLSSHFYAFISLYRSIAIPTYLRAAVTLCWYVCLRFCWYTCVLQYFQPLQVRMSHEYKRRHRLH